MKNFGFGLYRADMLMWGATGRPQDSAYKKKYMLAKSALAARDRVVKKVDGIASLYVEKVI